MRRAVLIRALVAAAAVGSMGSLCSNGPDCVHACDIVQGCPTLNKTFFLTCSDLGYPCLNDVPGDGGLASCAACIDSPGITCATLQAGICDPVCVPNYMPLGDAGVIDAGP